MSRDTSIVVHLFISFHFQLLSFTNNLLTQTQRISRSRISQLENENDWLIDQLPDNNFGIFAQLDENYENYQNGYDHDQDGIREFERNFLDNFSIIIILVAI